METQLEQIREQQKQSWNKFSSGWKKWDVFNMTFLRLIAAVFKQAGFKDIQETMITGQVDNQSFDRYWEMMLEVGAPIVAALAGADEATEAAIKAETAELFR